MKNSLRSVHMYIKLILYFRARTSCRLVSVFFLSSSDLKTSVNVLDLQVAL